MKRMGWRNESYRHGLAARGISTTRYMAWKQLSREERLEIARQLLEERNELDMSGRDLRKAGTGLSAAGIGLAGAAGMTGASAVGGVAGSDAQIGIISGTYAAQAVPTVQGLQIAHAAREPGIEEQNEARGWWETLTDKSEEELQEDVDKGEAALIEEKRRNIYAARKFDPMRPVDVREEPEGKQWRIERKFDGTRMIAHVDDGHVRLTNRRGVDKTKTFPELQELGKEVKGSAILDGEVVVFRKGKDDFKSLVERDHVKDSKKIRGLERSHPARYIVFDIVKRNGEDVRKLPYAEREQIIDKLIDKKGYVQRVTKTTVAKARKEGAEGVVFKDVTSPYVEGRSKHWQKYKFKQEADVAVVGWEPGMGKRKGKIGALKIATWDGKNKTFRNIGKVGTGFTNQDLVELTKKAKAGKPFVIRVQYLKRGSQGALREPTYIAERTDIGLKDTHV